ncbi:hypothetical protein CSA80_02525 [Candidatus Saccharibacteria bacterium]|nr:MAG: hypothetical protein CSA80_02525 [Candidatus Saccharibacteria bacterium]
MSGINPESIAIQGEPGSFHHQAANYLYPDNGYELVPCRRFSDVFSAVSSGNASHGLVAIENNLYGSINETYSLFREHPDMRISREVRMRIGQCLISHRPTTLEKVQEADGSVYVRSQSPAIAQVEHWLQDNLPTAHIEYVDDTALSVQQVMNSDNPNDLAIAGHFAAQYYGAHVAAADINDDPHNYTRFVLFSNRNEINPDASASSIILDTSRKPDRPGLQLSALAILFAFNINLTKNHSHPRGGKTQAYDFYLDTDAPLESRRMQLAIKSLRKARFGVQELGSYDRVAA